MMEKPTTNRQNTEQKRGRQAWQDVRVIAALGEKEQKEYRSLARGLNAMIQINGLGQTLGFLKAKGKNKDERGQPHKNAHSYLLGHLTHWMHDFFDKNIPDVTNDVYDGLLEWLLLKETTSSADYRRATTECLAFGTWLRRFAEAELKDPETPAPQGETV
ncbi:MAG: type III-B CRISPR module-associated protein Cmr5 [Ktedonobacteraceae bacterium]